MILLWRVPGHVVDLCSLPVVFILARKGLAFKAVKHLCDGFRRFCQHGLERHTRLQFAVFFEIEDTIFQHRRNNNLVARERTIPYEQRSDLQSVMTYL